MDKYVDYCRITDFHVFFWGGVFSNWHPSHFNWNIGNDTGKPTDDGKEFFCAEQAFMWAKAIHFKDIDIANKIMEVKDSPGDCKRLGRQVRNYDDNEWSKVRFDFMVSINFAKFAQNKDLARKMFELSDIGNRHFVEASPCDGIWGIRRHISDKDIDDETTWNGQNLLGKALDKVLRKIQVMNMLTVGQLVDYLKKYDQNANILVLESNAFDCGCWQHTDLDTLRFYVRSVEEDKNEIKKDNRYSDLEKEERLAKDYIYANDNDVIVRF